MNIETKHKYQKAHNNVKHRGNKDALQSPLESAASHRWQEQNNTQQKQDTAYNGKKIHKGLIGFKFQTQSQFILKL